MENKLILRNYLDIDIYNLNNYKLLFKQNIDWTGFKIYPFDEKHFILFDEVFRKAIFKLYNINSMKNVQNFEIPVKSNNCNFFPISNNEYVVENFIVTIDKE